MSNVVSVVELKWKPLSMEHPMNGDKILFTYKGDTDVHAGAFHDGEVYREDVKQAFDDVEFWADWPRGPKR